MHAQRLRFNIKTQTLLPGKALSRTPGPKWCSNTASTPRLGGVQTLLIHNIDDIGHRCPRGAHACCRRDSEKISLGSPAANVVNLRQKLTENDNKFELFHTKSNAHKRLIHHGAEKSLSQTQKSPVKRVLIALGDGVQTLCFNTSLRRCLHT